MRAVLWIFHYILASNSDLFFPIISFCFQIDDLAPTLLNIASPREDLGSETSKMEMPFENEALFSSDFARMVVSMISAIANVNPTIVYGNYMRIHRSDRVRGWYDISSKPTLLNNVGQFEILKSATGRYQRCPKFCN